MRIGIDARLYSESGVGRYINNLIVSLEKLDNKNSYFIFTNKDDHRKLKKQLVNPKWTVVEANIHWHSLKEQILLPNILNRFDLDLVHFPYFSVPILYFGKFIVTIHDLTINHFATGQASTLNPFFYQLKRFGYHLAMLSVIKRAKKIFVPSKATKNEIVEHFQVPEEKIAVTYEGVDKKIKYEKLSSKNACLAGPLRLSRRAKAGRIEASRQANPKLKKLKAKEYFLYVGNAYPHKNLERLVRAFLKLKTQNSKLKAKTKNLKLVLVGKSDYFYERLQIMVQKMRIQEELIFYGQANDQELSWLYQNALALIFPSLMEGFGLSALEAMSCGCLVLASDIPALKEVCGKVAVYLKPDDIKDMANKMADVAVHYDTVQYHSKIKLGLKRAKMFSWQKMVEETLRIYHSVIKESKAEVRGGRKR